MKNNVTPHRGLVDRAAREKASGHKGCVCWFTGLSGAGKSTIAHAVEKRLFDLGIRAYVFDGDNVRHGLCRDLGFSPEDRAENTRRIAEVAKLFVDNGTVCLCAFISPLVEDRERVRAILGDDYNEIFVDCPVPVCESRDVKGYYRLAREGKILNYTGVSAPYEAPVEPGLALRTHELSLEQCVEQTLRFVLEKVRNGK
ncbi:MAG: adenylyl-sulfate kinase [Desulfovibrionaceae bacterium]